MNDRIIHRGPDGVGYYWGQNFGFGHRRLKITDLSDQASQPMCRNGLTIIFNGEIYNYLEIAKLLLADGFKFSTKSDTEVILAAYQHWGKNCVSYFNGMWAFIIHDPIQNILFCSRDRLGIKPFCYLETDEAIYVGSEIKQFMDVPGFIPKLDEKIAFHFLFHGNISGGEKSFISCVKFLSAGSNLILDLANCEYHVEKWYSLDNLRINADIGYGEACWEFRKLFESSISLYTSTEVNFGTALSGGLDSSSIACMYKHITRSQTPLNTISTCFYEEPDNEIEYINEISNYLSKAGNLVFPDIRELLTDGLLKKIVYHQDQPILSGSFFSEYKLYEKASELGLKVMLSGQGADEYLAGYEHFHYFNVMNKLQKLHLVQALHEAGQFAKVNNQPRFYIFKNIGLSLVGRSYSSLKNKLTTSYHGNQGFNSAWLSKTFEFQNLNPELSLKGNFDLTHQSKNALSSYSLPHQLHSEDRHSMMFSVESRLPFLDHRLIEFSLQLPDHFKIKGGITKKLLRDSMKGILPEKIRNRHNKLGFPGPEDKLFEKENSVIKKQLNALIEKFPNIFSASLLEEYSEAVLSKKHKQSRIFRALSFYHWSESFDITA